MYLYHVPNIDPTDLGFVWLDIVCLHNPEFSRKAFVQQRQEVKLWLTNIDLNYKDNVEYSADDEWLYVRTSSRKGYKIRQDPAYVRKEYNDDDTGD